MGILNYEVFYELPGFAEIFTWGSRDTGNTQMSIVRSPYNFMFCFKRNLQKKIFYTRDFIVNKYIFFFSGHFYHPKKNFFNNNTC